MEKIAFLILLVIASQAVAFHYGSIHGREKAMKEFKIQVQSHKTFYDNEFKAKRQVHLVGE